ncbi:DUF2334 domain-containing protein [Candidatus Woesearchaeota archaeon]|nr:DUF2334 domain-containing protein [Candidatus Woesearchaeota archaeon]
MRVIIRDDDINFFTNPKLVNKIYGNCFENGVKICFGVTPLQYAIGGKLRKDIPENIPNKNFDISKNKDLCKLLKNLSLEGNEICMHGINHKIGEENIFENAGIENKFNEGINIIKKACKFKVKTYIAPFNVISDLGINFLNRKKINIACSFDNHYKDYFFPLKQFYFRNVIKNNGSKIFLSDECLFGFSLSKYKNPKICYEYAKKKFNLFYRLNKPFIIINHHWDFFDDYFMIKYWNDFISWILTKKNVQFTTFRDFA